MVVMEGCVLQAARSPSKGPGAGERGEEHAGRVVHQEWSASAVWPWPHQNPS